MQYIEQYISNISYIEQVCIFLEMLNGLVNAFLKGI